MTNNQYMVDLRGFGLHVVERVTAPTETAAIAKTLKRHNIHIQAKKVAPK